MSLELKLEFSQDQSQMKLSNNDSLKSSIQATLDKVACLDEAKLKQLQYVMTTIANCKTEINNKQEEILLAKFRLEQAQPSQKSLNFYDTLYVVNYTLSLIGKSDNNNKNNKKFFDQTLSGVSYTLETMYALKLNRLKKELANQIATANEYKKQFRDLCLSFGIVSC